MKVLKTLCSTSFIAAVSFLFLSFAGELQADIVTLTDLTPAGTADRNSSMDFVGILDNASPTEIGGQVVSFNNNLPGGTSFQVGDLVARDVDSTSADREWTFEIILPGDAQPGTGLTDISFRGFAFERTQNNLERGDQVTWALYLNSDTIPVASSSPGNGVDFSTHTVNFSDPGGASINRVRVVYSISGFTHNGEWVASRGQLSANYMAIPEPASAILVTLCWGVFLYRRRRKH